MGKVKELFMEQREMDVKKYPLTPKECYIPCPDCNGTGELAESNCCGGSIMEGICLICKNSTQPSKCQACNGTGAI